LHHLDDWDDSGTDNLHQGQHAFIRPGNMPIAAGLPNQQKPGSLLIFNLYTSSVNTSLSDTQISLTNTNPVSPANVHLFFVDGSSCSVADQIVTLTQNQTVTFRASDVDPE
jgi:hypothetical protein